MKNEEKVAYYLNNVASVNDRCVRPPALANELIITHMEIIKLAPP